MTLPSLLLLAAHAAIVPEDIVDMDTGEYVIGGDMDSPMDIVKLAPKAALVERASSLSGVGPEIPMPLYYSSPTSVLAVGPEGQLEHVKPEQLTRNQKEIMTSLSAKYFDSTGHLPIQGILGLCRQGFHTSEKMEHCIGTLSKMTPTNLAGMRTLFMAQQGVEDEGEDNLEHLKFLDRGKVLVPTGHNTMAAAEPGSAAQTEAMCSGFPADLVSNCVEVMMDSKAKQTGPAKSCPRMEIDSESFTTSHYAYSLDRVSPYFTQQRNFHFFDAEKELRTKYETTPSQDGGCGVRAKASFDRGDLIGLAAVAHATFVEGLMVALQETPWLGTNMNHCPEIDTLTEKQKMFQNHANAVIKLVEEDQKPTALWVYAAEPIAAGDEITMDYNEASAKYPNFISPAMEGWACKKSQPTHTHQAELRTHKDPAPAQKQTH